MTTRVRASELGGGVLQLTLEPAEGAEDARNWIDVTQAAALLRELRAANQAEDVRCVLLDAAGPMFAGGGDAELPAELFQFQQWMRVPVVCGLQGAVLGAGVGLAANAHLVVAAQGTSFGLTEVRGGEWPVGFEAVANAIGKRRALELALTGRVFGTPEALQMGLVHEMAPAFEYDDRAEAMARHLASARIQGRLPVT